MAQEEASDLDREIHSPPTAYTLSFHAKREPSSTTMATPQPDCPKVLPSEDCTQEHLAPNNVCTSESQTTFKYEGLDLSTDKPLFRLIQVHPGSADQIIECTIYHKQLLEPPLYEALSYTWFSEGNVQIPKTPTPILCNGARMMIPQSLETALCHLRRLTEPRLIWADAICINQKDDKEKTNQVRLMSDIYRKASQVLIWLGPERPGGRGEIALDLVPHVAAHSRNHVPTKDLYHQCASITEMELLACRAHGIEKFEKGDDIKNTLTYRAFAELLQRPWFTRTWIVQEAALASHALVLCGTKSVPWTDFLEAFSYCSRQPLIEEFFDLNNLNHAWGVLNTCREAQRGPGQRLLDLLLQHRGCGASDNRDKVFALCGLANDTGPDCLAFEPDYELTDVQTYTSIAISILKYSNDFDILSVPNLSNPLTVTGLDYGLTEVGAWASAQISNLKKSKDVEMFSDPRLSKPLTLKGLLPSWAPDWSARSKSTSFRARGAAEEPKVRHDALEYKKGAVEFSIDNKLLGIPGTVIDYISKVGDEHDTFDKPSVMYKVPAEQTILNNWEHISGARSWSKYITGEKMLDAYWQTLVAGCSRDQYDKLQKQFHLFDKTTKRFRMLHWVGLQHYKRSYIAASFAILVVSMFSDMIYKSFASPLSGGYATWEFSRKMERAVTGRRMVKTEKGYIGLATGDTQLGDAVVLIEGGTMPLILRQTGSEKRLVGDAYIHGIKTNDPTSKHKFETIWIG